MDEVLRASPAWLTKSLQGLAFWVGHRCSIYSGWALSEGALVGELCNLVHAHLGDDYSLRCEEPYSKFGVKAGAMAAGARVDLSVWHSSKDASGRRKSRPKYAIEVKRAKAPTAKIAEDLRRLAAIVDEVEDVRAFLCVVAEKVLPKQFVKESGYRQRGVFPISGSDSSYQVLNVLRASSHLKTPGANHYCCAIEVISNQVFAEAALDNELADE